jgi:two-component system, OmpR family, KDP operon response regulator KdpE
LSACRVLIVDDEPQIRRVIRTALTSHGFEPYEARTGEEALDVLKEFNPDAVLLDMNMPGIGGMETCRMLRATTEVPIIILSVRSGEGDKVAALDSGADDYLTKPFGVNELLARLRAHLRRMPAQTDGTAVLALSDHLVVDFGRRQLTADGKPIRLTPKEFELLHLLAHHPNQPVPHRKLLQTVWGPEYGEEVEYLRVFVSQLRKKIEDDPGKPKILLTEPWVGYRLNVPEEVQA